jgi:hypothetical protein
MRGAADAAEMPLRVREALTFPAGVQAQQAAGAFGGGANIRQPFPWFNCYCGDIDLIGQSKPSGCTAR